MLPFLSMLSVLWQMYLLARKLFCNLDVCQLVAQIRHLVPLDYILLLCRQILLHHEYCRGFSGTFRVPIDSVRIPLFGFRRSVSHFLFSFNFLRVYRSFGNVFPHASVSFCSAQLFWRFSSYLLHSNSHLSCISTEISSVV